MLIVIFCLCARSLETRYCVIEITNFSIETFRLPNTIATTETTDRYSFQFLGGSDQPPNISCKAKFGQERSQLRTCVHESVISHSKGKNVRCSSPSFWLIAHNHICIWYIRCLSLLEHPRHGLNSGELTCLLPTFRRRRSTFCDIDAPSLVLKMQLYAKNLKFVPCDTSCDNL